MLHNERMLATAHSLRAKDAETHRLMVARLQAENVEMLAELNVAKRDLKASRFNLTQ
jgi:hypothetical protein